MKISVLRNCNLRNFKLVLAGAACMLGTFSLSAQATVGWSDAGGGNNNDVSHATVTDTAGNIFVGGETYFLTKYDPAGNELWSKGAQGGGYQLIEAMHADDAGFVYITGSFEDSIKLGGQTAYAPGPGSSTHNPDVFTAKLDLDGNAIWIRAAGGSESDFVRDISVDLLGNVYITGRYGHGGITAGTLYESGDGYVNMFIIKYNAIGTEQWIKKYSSHYHDVTDIVGTVLHNDLQGNLYAGARLANAQKMVVAGDTISTVGTSPVGVVIKYDPLGNEVWAIRINNADYESAVTGIVSRGSYLYVSGSIRGGTGSIGTHSVTTADTQDDPYLAKISMNGEAQWMKIHNGTSLDRSTALEMNDKGELFHSIAFYQSITFGEYTYHSAGGRDMAIVKYDSEGNFNWAVTYGGTGDDRINALSSYADRVYFAGEYDSPSLKLGQNTYGNNGMFDFFVAELILDESTSLPTTAAVQPKLYPNPSTGLSFIQSQVPIRKVEVYGFDGRLISSIMSNNTTVYNMELSLDQQPKGVYLLKVTTDEAMHRSTLILR